MGLGIGKAIKKAGKKVSKAVKKATKQATKAAKTITESAIDVSTAGAYSSAKSGLKKIGDALTPEVPDIIIEGDEAAAAPQYVMPDEEEIMRARRRRGRASQSGRSSTILSDSGADRLGG